jgi:hypothetical protein
MHAAASALREHSQLLRFLLFAFFVLLGLVVATLRDSRRRRTALNMFLIYTLAVNALLVVVPSEAWPFSRYPMMAVPTVDARAETTMLSFRGVDASGTEWKIDTRAWSPLFHAAVMGWIVKKLTILPAGEREQAMLFLLRRANEARVAALNSRRFGNDILLGPLSAPDVFYYGDQAVPAPSDLVALRVYRIYWRPREYDKVRRALIAEQRLR